MKLLKPFLFAVTTTILLASCGSTVKPINAALLKNTNEETSKNAKIEEAQLKSWSYADLKTDTIPGMSVDKAYAELIPNLKGIKVIVAVIDSGIDIEHEDLKNVLWTNKDEVPNNGIDDDKNGYVDDVYGWNFLGDIVGENLEFVRIIKRYEADFEGKSIADVTEEQKALFVMYENAKAEYSKEYDEINGNYNRYNQMLSQVTVSHDAIVKKIGKEDYSAEDLAAIEDPTEDDQKNIAILSQMLSYGGYYSGIQRST